MAVDNKGNVYVADRGNNAVEEIPVGGGTTFVIGSGFSTPTGVAADAYGNVYVADNGHSLVKEIPAGNGTPITLGSGFVNPFTVAVDGSGNVFVADYGNHLVKEIPINGGSIMTVGSGYSFIFGVTTDIANNVYVTDYGHNAVKKINPTGGYYINPELPLGLTFNNTTGTTSGTPVAASPATTYTVTVWNQYGSNSKTLSITVNALTMSYASPQTYVAGTAITPLSPTGGHAAAPGYSVNTTTLGSGFNIPAGVAVDAQGNVFIGDQNNNALKEIPGGTGTPITIATGFSTPDGVAIDAQGNIYVADDGNNLVKEVPFVNGSYGAPVVLGFRLYLPASLLMWPWIIKAMYMWPTAAITRLKKYLLAAVQPSHRFGFSTPPGVAADAYGNIYVADNGHSAVKEIPAGNGTPVTLGSGALAKPVHGSGRWVRQCICDRLWQQTCERDPEKWRLHFMTIGSGYSFIFGVTTDIAQIMCM